MLNFDEDFKNFQSDTISTSATLANRLNLEALEINPKGDDTVFGAKFVFCGAHRTAHGVGWCTVRIAQKRPLNAQSKDAALEEIEALGFIKKYSIEVVDR